MSQHGSIAPSSVLTRSSVAPAHRASSQVGAASSVVPASAAAKSTTTVLQGRLETITKELESERQKRQAAIKQLSQTAKELEALEQILKLKK
jgi:hypothetical protein